MDTPPLANVPTSALPAIYRALLDESAPLPKGTQLLTRVRSMPVALYTVAAWGVTTWWLVKLLGFARDLYRDAGPADLTFGFMFGLHFVVAAVATPLSAMAAVWASTTFVREVWKGARLRKGRFRRGVFVTADAVLVCLDANACSLVPRAGIRASVDAEGQTVLHYSAAREPLPSTYRAAPTPSAPDELAIALASPDAPRLRAVQDALAAK